MSNQLDNDESHVFILRLWREQGSSDDAAPEWRALIENVSTSNRYPIQAMTALQIILAPFVDEIGLENSLISNKPKS